MPIDDVGSDPAHWESERAQTYTVSGEAVSPFNARSVSGVTSDESLLRDVLMVQPSFLARYTLDGRVVWCNEEYARHFARTPEQMLGASWLERSAELGFDTMEHLQALLAQLLLATEDGRTTTVVAPMWSDGVPRWIQWTNRRVAPSATGEQLLQAIGMDVTELRSARDALGALSQELLTGHVSDRRALARRIHDDVLQVLVSASWLLATEGEETVRADATVRSAELVQLAVQQLRALHTELTAPPVLLGSLAGAVEAEASALRSAGVQVEVAVEELSAEELRTVCTWVLVEGLRNVASHAAATQVIVKLYRVEDDVAGGIEDNGRGTSSEDLTIARAAGRMGLVTAQAMVESVGGQLWLDTSGRSAGTTLHFRVPLHGSSGDRNFLT